jgi:type II secretion system protein G
MNNSKLVTRNSKLTAGFTLIEMLVVVAIIGILASLITANISSGRERARDAKRKHDLGQVKSALRLYYNDYQAYPASTGGDINGCGIGGTASCSWGDSFSTDNNNYMNQIPVDPVNSGNYVYAYTQTESGEGFQLTTYLENSSDEDDGNSQLRCGLIADEADKTPQLYVACEN